MEPDEAIARHRADGPEPDLQRAIAAVLDALGPGDVVTYGEVAEEAGWPGRSRAVGRVLAGSGGAHPWWRVVNAAGRLVPGHEADQARRLADEGVEVDAERGRVRLRQRADSRPWLSTTTASTPSTAAPQTSTTSRARPSSRSTSPPSAG